MSRVIRTTATPQPWRRSSARKSRASSNCPAATSASPRSIASSSSWSTITAASRGVVGVVDQDGDARTLDETLGLVQDDGAVTMIPERGSTTEGVAQPQGAGPDFAVTDCDRKPWPRWSIARSKSTSRSCARSFGCAPFCSRTPDSPTSSPRSSALHGGEQGSAVRRSRDRGVDPRGEDT